MYTVLNRVKYVLSHKIRKNSAIKFTLLLEKIVCIFIRRQCDVKRKINFNVKMDSNEIQFDDAVVYYRHTDIG